MYALNELKVFSRGRVQAYIGFQTLVICQHETITSVPILKNYVLTNRGSKLSWDDQERIAQGLSGRLPTVDEVRHIIADKAGLTKWSVAEFSTGEGKDSGNLVSGF